MPLSLSLSSTGHLDWVWLSYSLTLPAVCTGGSRLCTPLLHLFVSPIRGCKGVKMPGGHLRLPVSQPRNPSSSESSVPSSQGSPGFETKGRVPQRGPSGLLLCVSVHCEFSAKWKLGIIKTLCVCGDGICDFS